MADGEEIARMAIREAIVLFGILAELEDRSAAEEWVTVREIPVVDVKLC